MATSQTLPRGGMSKHPFANEPRLDRLDFTNLVSFNTPPEKAICLQTITDAVHNYKFFGLGRNGTTANEFAYSCEYLFRVRSWDSSTWFRGPDKIPDAQLKAMCFDVHYEVSGMSVHMTMDRFLINLVKKRTAIVDGYYQQIMSYIGQMYLQECEAVKPGHQLPLPLQDRRSTLISPSSSVEIARLIYLPQWYRLPPAAGIRKRKKHDTERAASSQS